MGKENKGLPLPLLSPKLRIFRKMVGDNMTIYHLIMSVSLLSTTALTRKSGSGFVRDVISHCEGGCYGCVTVI